MTTEELCCPFGGDITNDCADCVYSGDYHFICGECVRRAKPAQNKKALTSAANIGQGSSSK